MVLLKIIACTIFLSSIHPPTIQTQPETGKASYYASKFHGRPTASGELYDEKKLTAAHLSLPFGTIVKITNLKNNLSVTVTINDRGPFIQNRVIDLSFTAAQAIGMINDGVVEVIVQVVED